MSNSPVQPTEGSTIHPAPSSEVAKGLAEFLGEYRKELINQGYSSDEAFGLIQPQVVDLVRNVQITISKVVEA